MFVTNHKKNAPNNLGFTLIEMAIVIVVLGIILVPVLMVYEHSKKEQAVEQNHENLESVVRALSGFQALYGYYPAPAPTEDALGDLSYGRPHEDIDSISLGNCDNGVCYGDTVAGDPDNGALIGGVPFKVLNIPQEAAYDSYLNRINYAVSKLLVDPDTFAEDVGSIEVLDRDGNSLASPPASMNFLVYSSGPNRAGGKTSSGSGLSCASGSFFEMENCDQDGTFVSVGRANDFDDDVNYYNSVTVENWQRVVNLPNIHLKNAGALSIGAGASDDLTGAADVSVVRDLGGGSFTGTIYASPPVNSTESPSSVDGLFFSNELCDGDECFAPKDFAGTLTQDIVTGLYYKPDPTSGGISCYDQTETDPQFMVNVEGAGLGCSDEVYVYCPDTVITSFDAEGNVVCAEQPPLPCTGGIKDIPYCSDDLVSFDDVVQHGEFAHLYSGDCNYFVNNIDAQYLIDQGAEGLTFAEAQALVNTLNNTEKREDEFCGPDETTALVRDNYYCNDGTFEQWDSTERWYNTLFGGTLTSPTASYPYNVENSYTGEIPAPSGQEHYHDCRCEENLRVWEPNCNQHYTGTEVHYQKLSCPQTHQYWATIYEDESACLCDPGPFIENETCLNYYYELHPPPESNTILYGDVELTYNIICENNEPVIEPPEPTNVDISQCLCPNLNDNVTRNNCPPGLSNEWESDYGTEYNVESMSVNKFECFGINPGSGMPIPGAWTGDMPYSGLNWNNIPDCICDASGYEIVEKSCCFIPGQPDNPSTCPEVGQTSWEVPYICAGNPEDPPILDPDESNWTYRPGLSECNSCSWESSAPPTLVPNVGQTPAKGSACNCSTELGNPLACYTPYSGTQVNQWPCQCQED